MLPLLFELYLAVPLLLLLLLLLPPPLPPSLSPLLRVSVPNPRRTSHQRTA